MFNNHRIVINLQVRVAICKQTFQSEDLYNIATRLVWCKALKTQIQLPRISKLGKGKMKWSGGQVN